MKDVSWPWVAVLAALFTGLAAAIIVLVAPVIDE